MCVCVWSCLIRCVLFLCDFVYLCAFQSLDVGYTTVMSNTSAFRCLITPAGIKSLKIAAYVSGLMNEPPKLREY